VSATAWLYLASPDDLDDPALLRRCETLLTEEELARRDCYTFERGRREFLLTRVLARTSLSRHAPVAPGEWRFAIGEFGRPRVTAPPTQLSFNLSNTDGLVACLVSPDAEVGVDVEAIDRPRDTAILADRCFAPSEAAAVRAAPEQRRNERFTEYWALKEAYLKARGTGLSLRLSDFWFELSEGAPIRVRFAPSLADDPARWSFALLRPSPRHVAAALRCAGDPPELRVVRVHPLLEVGP
jgi:4'-phosphopantetheinyl transferase